MLLKQVIENTEVEMDNVIKMKLISKPKKMEPIKGNMSFNWKDVEIIECGANGNAILHFKSGRSLKVNKDFESAKLAFHKFK